MSYFSDRRKANYEANKAAIATHKTLSPYADYEGGKYEPMQYEGNPEDTEWMESHEALEDDARRENESR